jgi:hypothetical protein
MPMDRDGTLAAAQLSGRPGLASTQRTISEDRAARTVRSAVTQRQGKSGASELISVRVNRFLADRVPWLFCDDCITDELGLSHRRQANRVTVALGKDEAFWRDIAACSVCRKHKQVIRHV